MKLWMKVIGFGVCLTACVVGQENGLIGTRKVMTLDCAKVAIAAAVAEARRVGAPGGAIAVVDNGGHVIGVERLDGTFAAAWRISIGKARTSAVFGKPTSAFEKIIREGRTPMLALEDFTPLQGGVPIIVDGQVVGAIGVSGASSALQDEELAMAGAAAVAAAVHGSSGVMQGKEPVQNASKVGMVIQEVAAPPAARQSAKVVVEAKPK